MSARDSRSLVTPRTPRPQHLRRLRWELPDGAVTTVHLAAYAVADTELRVTCLRPRLPLEAWCAARGVEEALVGGFYMRGTERLTPLGELRTRGIVRSYAAFDAPWDQRRACVNVAAGTVRIAPRPTFGPSPAGDLLQAGPQLVRSGQAVVVDGVDPEGFSAASGQFDSDITAGRHPRAALAVVGAPVELLLAVACDGRARDDAGLTLGELARLLVMLGATDALNLDGGGSTSLVCGGRLRNRPREAHEADVMGGRTLSTALVFRPRSR